MSWRESVHDMPEEDYRFLRESLTTAEFRTAKSMPNNPHSYTLARTWTSQADFDRCVDLIRRHGYVERFCTKDFPMVAFGGCKYWIGMDWRVYDLINRKELGIDGHLDDHLAE